MKRFFSLFLSFVLLFAVCACSREKNLTELEEIQQQLAEMEGYACTATLIRQTENGEKIYQAILQIHGGISLGADRTGDRCRQLHRF